MNQKLAVLAACTGIFIMVSGIDPALAWGSAGHSVVAEIAERRLNRITRGKIADLMGSYASLASLASWADTYSKGKPETLSLHYVNIPFEQKTFARKRDCRPLSHGSCIVAALEREFAVLSSQKQPRAARQRALKLVVHLVADIHQPLHCSDRNDQGGNTFSVTFFGQPTNLHLLWDFGMLDRESFDWGVHATAVERVIEQKKLSERSVALNFVDWVNQCHRVAASIYPSNNQRTLSKDYQNKFLPITYQALARAAVRLTAVLDKAFESI